jgi:hypothetical protein
MKNVVALLPGSRVKDSPNPINWNIRVNEKVAIDLRLLLAHQEAWLGIISDLRDQIGEIQAGRPADVGD